MILVGKRPRTQLVIEAGRFLVVVDAYIAKIGSKTGLHVAAYIG